LKKKHKMPKIAMEAVEETLRNVKLT